MYIWKVMWHEKAGCIPCLHVAATDAGRAYEQALNIIKGKTGQTEPVILSVERND